MGSVEWEGGFEPFGADFSGAPESGVFLRFFGQWKDESWAQSGVGAATTYNLFRWYGSRLGRYSRPDPLGLDMGENLYWYAIVRPTSLNDLDGRLTVDGAIGIFVAGPCA